MPSFYNDLALESQQLFVLSLWLLLAGFILLLVLGLRARVVVFFDWRDLAWTLSPPAALLLGYLVSQSLMPPVGDPHGTTVLADAAMGAAKGIAVLGLLVSLGYAVRYNGVLLGVPVFVFKLVAPVVAGLVAFLLWPVKGRLNPILLPFLIVGCLLFLTNGERVMRRRAQRQAARLAASVAASPAAVLELRDGAACRG